MKKTYIDVIVYKIAIYTLGVSLVTYIFHKMDETLESVQKNKNSLQAKLYDLLTSGEKNY